MDAEKRQLVLAAARHEFSDYSITHLESERERKILLDEYDVGGYVLSKGEILALFEMLIKERLEA